MLECGKVEKVEGESVLVLFERHAACAGCGACMSAGEKQMQVLVKNTLGAKVGDAVSVSMSSKSFYEAAFLAYILPLVAMLAALFVASAFTSIDWLVAVIALAAALAAYALLRLFEPRLKKSAKFAPKMIELL